MLEKILTFMINNKGVCVLIAALITLLLAALSLWGAQGLGIAAFAMAIFGIIVGLVMWVEGR